MGPEKRQTFHHHRTGRLSRTNHRPYRDKTYLQVRWHNLTLAIKFCNIYETFCMCRSKGGHDHKLYALELEFNQDVVPQV